MAAKKKAAAAARKPTPSKRAVATKRPQNLGRTEPPVPTSPLIFVGRQPSGVRISTAEDALKNATVWACVQFLSRTIAQLPWRVMRENGKGSEVVDTNPADWLLHRRPCADMGAFSWRQTMMAYALLRGNAYAEIQRDNRGAAYALWPINPDRVTPRRAENGELEYEVWNAGAERVVLPAADTFHLRGFGEGPVGYSVIEYAAQSIGWAQATEMFGATYFGEGMNPTGIIEVQKGLSQPAMEILREQLSARYKGTRGSRTLFLDAGMKFSKNAINPDESQFIESRQHQVEEICRWFGVPPHKVMHLLRATFSNIEHQSIEVVVDSITPWARALEDEADYKLFGFNREGLFTKINMRGLMRGDNASRATYYRDLFNIGAMTINRILQLEDENTIGPDGDIRFVPLNMVPLDKAREAADARTKPPPTAPAADPPPGDPAAEPAAENPKPAKPPKKANGHRLSH